MEYPRFVYISPGETKCVGGTFGYDLVKDEIEHKAALFAGFSDSVPEALESAKAVKETITTSVKLEDIQEPRKLGRPPKAVE
jgi:hypothetical protein